MSVKTTIWTLEEIKQYQPRDYAPLKDLYVSKGLTDANPEARAEFLTKILDLTPTDNEVVMRKAEKQGRHTALNFLEDMVISAHQDKINKTKAKITLPLD